MSSSVAQALFFRPLQNLTLFLTHHHYPSSRYHRTPFASANLSKISFKPRKSKSYGVLFFSDNKTPHVALIIFFFFPKSSSHLSLNTMSPFRTTSPILHSSDKTFFSSPTSTFFHEGTPPHPSILPIQFLFSLSPLLHFHQRFSSYKSYKSL